MKTHELKAKEGLLSAKVLDIGTFTTKKMKLHIPVIGHSPSPEWSVRIEKKVPQKQNPDRGPKNSEV